MADWFAPKRYGYGVGLPISWQGWAVLLAYIGVVGLAAWLLRPTPMNILAVVLPATVAVLLITMRTTRGGWRWRWGDRD